MKVISSPFPAAKQGVRQVTYSSETWELHPTPVWKNGKNTASDPATGTRIFKIGDMIVDDGGGAWMGWWAEVEWFLGPPRKQQWISRWRLVKWKVVEVPVHVGGMREREKREICFVIEVQPIRGRQVASSPSAEVFTVAATSDLIATVRSTIRACAQFGYLCLLIGHLYHSIFYHVSYLLANKCYVF